MISTSSSECDCTGTFGFGTALPTMLGNPFCSAARQPLIYYAKVQEPCCQQEVRKRKGNSNYFMKAFHWYTQELGSGHRKDLSQANHSGFAAWLDKKYSEYLKGQHREGSNIILNRPSTVDSNGLPKNKKSKRKFGRMRSPWRRRHGRNSVGSNMNQSIHYILQPQDLPRPASECYQRTSRIQSTTTMQSKESPKNTKIKVKSKSLLSIYSTRHQHDTGKFSPKLKARDVHCECLKKDGETQYETYSLETFATPCYNYERSQDEQQTLQKDVLIHQPNSVPKTTVMFTDNSNVDASRFQNLTVQTSDHSIKLGHDMFAHPLFLRVEGVNK